MGGIFLRLQVGGAAGLIAWALMEPSAPKNFFDEGWEKWSLVFVAVIGAFVGLAVGGLDGYLQGTRTKFLRGAILGLVFGAIGSTFGFGIGGTISESVFGEVTGMGGNIVQQMLARIIAFVFMGLALGFAIGLSSMNFRKAVQGLVGGGIGAAIAGMLFDPVSAMVGPLLLAVRGGNEVGIVGRVILSMVQGALIGLFIGIVERVARSAWVRQTLGRNEGREWSVDQVQNFIGRSEMAQIPLFGDMNVQPNHACIVRQGPNDYLLADGGSPAGTFLDGQRIQQASLYHGAVIGIGSHNLQFLLKNRAVPVRGPESYQGQSFPVGGQNPGYTTIPSAQPAQAPAPPIVNSVVLTATDGVLMGQRFPISGSVDLGREQPAIPLSFDSQVSRRHAHLALDVAGLTVTDLGSTNGTFVNGIRVHSQKLERGDFLKIGATTFRVD